MFGQIASIATALGASLGFTSQAPQNQVHQVAIIGAGPAGSSAAYYVNKYAEDAGIAVNITLFEKTDRIGGRALTVPVYGSGEPVELGASIFIEVNHILYNATNEFGLNPTAPGAGDDDEGGVLGIWDGDEIIFTMDQKSSKWWNLGKLFWKYGLAPYRTKKLMESTIGSFLEMYRSPNFPFKSLSEVVWNLGLNKSTGVTGAQWLKENNIGDAYAHDIVQASTRVNYAANTAYIHGLDSMVAMAPDGAMQIQGGNWQIFDRMVNASGAHVCLDCHVSAISKTSGSGSRYSLKLAGRPEEAAYGALFDDVVLAAPFQYSKMEIEDGILDQPIEEVPYADLHVTLFTSPLKISPSFFNLPVGSVAPTTILTTLAKDDEPAAFPDGAGKPGFYSISTLRNTTNPKTHQEEFIYKIFSPDKVTAEFLSRLFGVKIPDAITGANTEDPGIEPISWFYPYGFHAYPIAYPRVAFQDPILAPGLFYSSGMESFISTMETSALSGMNIAKLIVDRLTSSVPTPEPGADGEQKVVVDEAEDESNQEL